MQIRGRSIRDFTDEELLRIMHRRRIDRRVRMRRRAEFDENRREEQRREAEIERWRRLCRQAFGLPL